MLLVKAKPITPGTRIKSYNVLLNVYNKKIFSFFFKKTKKSGRIFSGLIGTRHKKNKCNSYTTSANFSFKFRTTGVVVSFFRLSSSKYFSLIKFCDGSFFVTGATSNVYLGSLFFFLGSLYFFPFVKSSFLINTFIYLLKPATLVSYIKYSLNSQAKFCRAAGCFGQLYSLHADKKMLYVVLPSGSKKVINFYSVCSLGRVGNELKSYAITGKAGINILLGVRPTVRGNAMNPIDHPHGGRTKTNQPEVSP